MANFSKLLYGGQPQQAGKIGLPFMQAGMQMMQQKQAMEFEKQKFDFMRKLEAEKFKVDKAKLEILQKQAELTMKEAKLMLPWKVKGAKAGVAQKEAQTKTIAPESEANIAALEALASKRTSDIADKTKEEFEKRVKEREIKLLQLLPKEAKEKLSARQLRKDAIQQLKEEDFEKEKGYLPIRGTGSTEPKGFWGNIGAYGKGLFSNPLTQWQRTPLFSEKSEKAKFIDYLIKDKKLNVFDAQRIATEQFGK